MRLDFHLHTHRSDGSLPAIELYHLAKQQRLKAWSITDHDTCRAYDDVPADETLFCGVEITTAFEGHEIHVLGLGVDRHDQGFDAFLSSIREIRRQRADAMLQAINADMKQSIQLADVQPEAAEVVTRLHLAVALQKLNLIRHRGAFFTDVMPDERMHTLNLPDYPSVAAAAAQIHAAGGQAILAHPARYDGIDLVQRILQADLDGFELKFPNCDAAWDQQLRKLVQDKGYIVSCGSDLHWSGRRQPGDCRLSHAEAAPLLERLGWSDPLKS